MSDLETLTAIAADLNDVPESAARTQRHVALVEDTNTLIRTAADALVTLDSSPLSFAVLKSASEPRA